MQETKYEKNTAVANLNRTNLSVILKWILQKCQVVKWIQLSQDIVKWRSLIKKVIPGSIKGNSRSAEVLAIYQEGFANV